MDRHLFLTWTNAVEGREAEFNEWYERHVEEVLDTPGFVTAQRYELSDTQRPGLPTPPWRYLAVYEFECDPAEVHDILAERAHMRSFSTACAEDHAAWVYCPIGAQISST